MLVILSISIQYSFAIETEVSQEFLFFPFHSFFEESSQRSDRAKRFLERCTLEETWQQSIRLECDHDDRAQWSISMLRGNEAWVGKGDVQIDLRFVVCRYTVLAPHRHSTISGMA